MNIIFSHKRHVVAPYPFKFSIAVVGKDFTLEVSNLGVIRSAYISFKDILKKRQPLFIYRGKVCLYGKGCLFIKCPVYYFASFIEKVTSCKGAFSAVEYYFIPVFYDRGKVLRQRLQVCG
ncbi:MAG: hypothetical protein DDT19_00741 [Syntrophomonadaceae bacterium]|nr:hypothetical protein [Bacillota bacterium]